MSDDLGDLGDLGESIEDELPEVEGFGRYNHGHYIHEATRSDGETWVRAGTGGDDVGALLDAVVSVTEAAVRATDGDPINVAIHTPERLARLTAPAEWREMDASERRHRIIHATEIE